MNNKILDDLTKPSKSDSSKRPSQKLYVPKHMRNSTGNGELQPKTPDESLNTSINKMNFDDPSIVGYIKSPSDENSLVNSLQSLNISSNSKKCQINEMKSHSPDNDNENEWFNLYDETGESKSNNEISIPLRSNKDDKIDYLKFEPIENLNDEEYGHVIEIYDFPISFKNENIYNAFKEEIGHQNFDIKWVDDNHCLGIFSSTTEAANVLKMNHGLLKTRPLSKSGDESRAKAQRLVNTLKPYKARPQTTSFVATRLIGASLGINNLISKEKLKVEKSKLDNARTKHKKEKELKESIWQGQ